MNYYPNNWEKYKEAPESLFIDHTYDELMEWKVSNWELPSSVFCIIRATNTNTKKIKEYVYQRRSAAEKRIRRLLNTGGYEVSICTDEAIHHLYHDNEITL